MGLHELITALEADAEAELARRRAATGEEVARIHAAADAQASALLRRAVDEGRAAADTRAEREVLAARARSAEVLRQVREAELDAVLAQVHGELDGAREHPGYPSALEAMLREAMAVLPHAAHVHVGPRDGGLVRDLLARAENPAQVIEDLRCAGGLVVAAPGRRVDNTVESRLAAAWPRLRSALAAAWADELEAGRGA